MKFRDRRWPTDYRLDVFYRSRMERGQVSDVSRGGLKMRLDRLALEPGDQVRLSLATRLIDGIVRWRRGHVIGVSFRPGLSDDVLRELTLGAFDGRPPSGAPTNHRRHRFVME